MCYDRQYATPLPLPSSLRAFQFRISLLGKLWPSCQYCVSLNCYGCSTQDATITLKASSPSFIGFLVAFLLLAGVRQSEYSLHRGLFMSHKESTAITGDLHGLCTRQGLRVNA